REDYIEFVQQEVLERVTKIRFGKEGYIFIIKRDGEMLLNAAHEELVGKNISAGLGDNFAQVVRKCRIAAAKPGGGFIGYEWYKPSSQKPAHKTSFVMGVPDWKWMVGAGVYTDEIDKIIAEKHTALKDSVRGQVFKLVILFLVIFAFVLFLTLLFSHKLEKQLEVFITFFRD
ncbi:MAG: hypothetical protein GY950_11245, partial [bacterium]|nr:hypothetical protein [bacterium]